MKYLKTLLVLFYLLLVQNLLAQDNIRIIEILDANLFLTEDSNKICLANLNVPSIKDADSTRRVLADNIMEYGRITFLKHKSRFVPSPQKSCSPNDIVAGHLFRKYPLGELNINAEFLKKGYAVYFPCDTLNMSEYSDASETAYEKTLGVWKPVTPPIAPDYFNRFRISAWLVQFAFETESPFPFVGFNYRWSNILSLYEKESLAFNLSAEAGTFVYFFFPYVNLGTELRYKYVYARAHYNELLPIFWVVDDDEIQTVDYWGYDVGFQIPIGNKSGIEIEFSAKGIQKKSVNLISISFVSY